MKVNIDYIKKYMIPGAIATSLLILIGFKVTQESNKLFAPVISVMNAIESSYGSKEPKGGSQNPKDVEEKIYHKLLNNSNIKVSDKSINYVYLDKDGEDIAVEDGAGNSIYDKKTLNYDASIAVEKEDWYRFRNYETYNRIEGVDEGDIVKTDGEYIYVLDENESFFSPKISIYSAKGGIVKKVSKIVSKGIYIRDMYIDGDRLISIGIIEKLDKDYSESHKKKQEFPGSNWFETRIMIYDIADRNNPQLIAEHKQEGVYVSSRINDGCLYTASTRNYDLSNRGVCLPYIDDKCCEIEKVIIPDYIENNQYTISTSVKLSEPDKINDKIAVYGGGSELYMSAENMYIVDEMYKDDKIDDSETNEYKEPKTRVFLNDYDLNYENQSKNKLNKYERYVLKNGFPDYDADEIVKKIQIKDVRRSNVSKIYKFNLQKGNFVFVSDNTVEGWIENKLCMNEKDSYLIVFSTTSENTIKLNNFDYYYEGKRISGDSYVAYVYFDEEEHNSVTVFDEKMKQVSKIDGIAEGEKITQAKFIGNFGYMVTETNPLFTIDFSDNTKPVVGGALKMPGYLYDLLPFGDNLFLGFGSKDNQLKLDLYNIKDNIAKKNTNKVSVSEYYCYETGNSDATMVDGKNGYIGFCAGIVDEELIYNLYQYNDGNFKQIKEIPIENIDAEKIRARIIGDYLYVIVLEDGIYSVNINLTDNDVMYTSF